MRVVCSKFRTQVTDKHGRVHYVVDNELWLDKDLSSKKDLKDMFPNDYEILSLLKRGE